MTSPLELSTSSVSDVERARLEVRKLASGLGFSREEADACVLAASELATNLVRYSIQGRIILQPLLVNGRRGLRIESLDAGPGIQDLSLAMQDGYSTGGGLGSGLPGVRRLMDEFQIESAPSGTRVVVAKWTRTT